VCCCSTSIADIGIDDSCEDTEGGVATKIDDNEEGDSFADSTGTMSDDAVCGNSLKGVPFTAPTGTKCDGTVGGEFSTAVASDDLTGTKGDGSVVSYSLTGALLADLLGNCDDAMGSESDDTMGSDDNMGGDSWKGVDVVGPTRDKREDIAIGGVSKGVYPDDPTSSNCDISTRGTSLHSEYRDLDIVGVGRALHLASVGFDVGPSEEAVCSFAQRLRNWRPSAPHCCFCQLLAVWP